MDANYRGIIDQGEFIGLIQSFRVESELYEFEIKTVTIKGLDILKYSNIYE